MKETSGVTIVITEGAKKAASLLSHGYCAIALPGIFNGYRSKMDDIKLPFPRLIPQLEVFATQGREFAFAFDRDTKLKTIRNVQMAIEKTGKLIIGKGCKVSVVSWSQPYRA